MKNRNFVEMLNYSLILLVRLACAIFMKKIAPHATNVAIEAKIAKFKHQDVSMRSIRRRS